jgi:hypothetical protein
MGFMGERIHKGSTSFLVSLVRINSRACRKMNIMLLCYLDAKMVKTRIADVDKMDVSARHKYVKLSNSI